MTGVARQMFKSAEKDVSSIQHISSPRENIRGGHPRANGPKKGRTSLDLPPREGQGHRLWRYKQQAPEVLGPAFTAVP